MALFLGTKLGFNPDVQLDMFRIILLETSALRKCSAPFIKGVAMTLESRKIRLI